MFKVFWKLTNNKLHGSKRKPQEKLESIWIEWEWKNTVSKSVDVSKAILRGKYIVLNVN